MAAAAMFSLTEATAVISIATKVVEFMWATVASTATPLVSQL